jgi:hypothetical protein
MRLNKRGMAISVIIAIILIFSMMFTKLLIADSYGDCTTALEECAAWCVDNSHRDIPECTHTCSMRFYDCITK